MSVDVVVSYRKLASHMTPYTEHSRETWRWKWLAWLFNIPGGSIHRDEGGVYIVRTTIEPTPDLTSELILRHDQII